MKNIGVIGCGYWGKNLVRNFYELKSLYAICDIDENNLKSFREKYSDVIFYNDYKNLLKDPKAKAVVIATPSITHYTLTKESLLADKDVFVEKPIALNYKDGEELVSLAKEKNKILMVGHILEYHPAIIKLKELINKGKVGKINYVYSNRLNLGKFRTEENILWSFAPHDISVILNILGEMPEKVWAHGGNYLNPNITDVTITTMDFPSGVKVHIFVSWLHPYKEQKLVIIGDKKMIVFDDVNPKDKLFLYNHRIDWIGRQPVPYPEKAQPVKIKKKEPLKSECEHFIKCITSRKTPQTDGNNALQVLKILEACQASLKENGKVYRFVREKYFIHQSSFVDENVEIGQGTKIWHFCHILRNTKIGKNCVLGQNVMVGPDVVIGNNVKIQNNVSVYKGVILEDGVFCGPSCVFTNVVNPRAFIERKKEFKNTLVKKGATLGANCTIICGNTIGKYAMVGAGAVVTKDIPDYAIVTGIPAKIYSWSCKCGTTLKFDKNNYAKCSYCGNEYSLVDGKLEAVKEN